MEIVMRKVKDLRPYENNPRKNDTAVKDVAASIRDFGFKVPMVIEADGTVVTGHTRLKAAKRLKIKEVPCIVADDLTEEQIRAFRLADNKVSEKAEWDFDKLDIEIGEIFEFDMGEYGFDLMEEGQEEREHEIQQELTQDRVDDLQNLAKAIYPGSGYYDIPTLEPVTMLPDVSDWIGFNYVLSDDDPTGKGVHFFLHDYQFERTWNRPELYVDKLARYAAVASPDFSTYTDFPRAIQIYNHYRKHWLGYYWQERGINVIPTISWSDEESFNYCFDGEPRGGVVIVSSVGTQADEASREMFQKGYKEMMRRLDPCMVLLGGTKIPDGIGGNVELIGAFQQRFKNGGD